MIRALRSADADAFLALRRQALLDAPLAFLSSPADDLGASLAAARAQLRRAPEAVVFGALAPALVGMVGLYRDRHLKAGHKAHLWGMYVTPAHRRHGLGAALLQTAVTHAREIDGVTRVHLGVSEAAPAARRLYERLGFTVWGTEPDALSHGGETVAEHHMMLRL
jgi:RimJ/RimL family protein N-acetyltransferase